MGWCLKHLHRDQRDAIARQLFVVQTEDGDWINGLCPFHKDNNPSFGYNLAEDYFKCLKACTKEGDLIDLFCHVRGLPLASSEGIKAFKAEFASIIGVAGADRLTPGQLRHKAEKAEQQAPKARDNLLLPERVWEAQTPLDDAWLAELRIRRGWSKEVIEAVGVRLLTHFRRKTDLYSLFPLKVPDRVVIPCRDAKGDLRNLRCYRPISKDGDQGPKIMSWGKGHGSAMLLLPPGGLRDGPVYLCEGEADWLCALSRGLNAITQTGKPNHWPKEHLAPVRGRDIVICYDADQPGQEYALKAASSLSKAGCRCSILEWPPFMGRQQDGTWPEDKGQDLTDFFVRHAREIVDFMALAERAKPFGKEQEPQQDEGQQGAMPWLRYFGMSASGRYTFRERALADHLCEMHPMLYHDKSGQLYRWNGQHYETWSDDNLRRAAIDALGEEATAARVNATSSIAMTLATVPHLRDLNDRSEWVCLENGMLNLYTLEMQPHDRDFLATIKLGVRFDPGNTPPPERWLQFLSETIQTEGPILQLQEFMGYALTRMTKFDKCLLLLGPGSDGKSQVIKVLRRMVGEANCSAISMTGLEDQFQRAALWGKLLNVGTEVSTAALESEYFKAVCTGDPIQASFKHKDSFEFTPFCKLIYAANKLPRMKDNSDGYFRRILPIRFKRQFLENDPHQDPDLLEKLFAELPGIFEWSVFGLHRLLAQKRFTSCDETRDLMMDYRRYNNPVLAFVQDKCRVGSDLTVDLKELFGSFKSYCSEGGYKGMNRENFARELEQAVRKINEDIQVRTTRPRTGGMDRPYVVSGLCINSYGDAS